VEALVVIVVLVSTVIIGTTLGGRYSVAPPVLLIVLGTLLGLIPRLTDVELDPDLVLLLFLPAILYWESLNTSLREIRANLRVIILSSVGLVIVTAATVALAARALGMDHRAAWVLGAVLAPTDAAAVSGLAKRLPRRMLTTLRAESLINDGTALVLFALAVSAAQSGTTPSVLELVGRFIGSYAGGIAVGVLTGVVVTYIRRHLDDPLREGALSFVQPFAAFLIADALHVSGVVAVVVSGLILTYVGPRVIRARSRVQAFAFWDLSTFMLNGSLFVLVGLQIPRAVRQIRAVDITFTHAVLIALAITGVVIGTRLLWTFLLAYVVRAIDRRPSQRARRVTWRARFTGGWAGFRGAPFPDRDLIFFVTSVVILVTVVLEGTTLPVVVRWAHLPEDTARADELRLARTTSARAALDVLPQVAAELGVDGELLEQVRAEYEQHAAAIQAEDNPDGHSDAVQGWELSRKLRLGVLGRKRQAVTELRDENRIDDIVLRELQASMDLEEVRLLGPVPTE
jgi:monovalent cation/hydrogen antiporter